MKKTAVAPSNIAFIKYWGKKNEELRLPSNGSISMNLNNLTTTTTVEFMPGLREDSVTINGKPDTTGRITHHLERVRRLADITDKARVMSVNSFPSSTGLSSSASGFAALSVAAAAASGLTLSEKELTILARQGSGSACRSIPDGFVEWLDGSTSDTSYAESFAPHTFWDIADVVAIVSDEMKDVSSTEGQALVGSSIFFPVRLSHMKEKIRLSKKLIADKNFTAFGQLIEAEALEMHAVMLTSRPSLMYWLPTTVLLMKEIRRWRKEGLQAYFTINTGQDVHVICEKKDIAAVHNKLQAIREVKKIIENNPSPGTRLTEDHLF